MAKIYISIYTIIYKKKIRLSRKIIEGYKAPSAWQK